MNEYQNPLPHETYIRIMILDDGSALIEDVTYAMFHTATKITYWDKKFYHEEKARYIAINHKGHTYHVCDCEPELAKKIVILYHARRGKLPKWNFD